jgi:hypothetical protein
MSTGKPPAVGAGNEKWGISVEADGTVDPATGEKILATAKKMLPHLLEVIAKAHGVNASGFSANIKRSSF